MIPLSIGAMHQVAVVGAHCDDIAIGMGGALLTLSKAHPGIAVRALVLSGAGTQREAEERDALAAFCPGADVDLTVLDIPDGHAPAHWERVKESLRYFRSVCAPDLVFGPPRADAHQDHRMLGRLLPTEFRDHLVFGYQILKWDKESVQPNCYLPLTTEVAETKASLLMKCYPSQTARDWFDEDAFLGLSRLRGVQCRSAHAEAFVAEKATLDFTSR